VKTILAVAAAVAATACASPTPSAVPPARTPGPLAIVGVSDASCRWPVTFRGPSV
jgi:hypothetical protein